MRFLPYNRNLKQLSRDLRNNSTLGEILLWKQLRARGMMGYQFYRQKPLDNYIVDFYCPALKLIIEIDGQYHSSEEDAVSDDIQQKKLEEWNLNFVRFQESEIRKDMINVLRTLENYIFEYQKKHPEVLGRNHRGGNPPNPL
jgi:very-short-patch-repair endonuclease